MMEFPKHTAEQFLRAAGLDDQADHLKELMEMQEAEQANDGDQRPE